ncbi:GNAT family N-acetyltransferase [Lactococcus nasutitermitis]|uniref:GNAT family N-acetyltransferase n=1 Tax=Lactococcus nasutitermitis TaxID=1652957 RepID=A0ABV9JE38_9LACT|nr:GNAT family protein [Lactococcus nasutitermitis]
MSDLQLTEKIRLTEILATTEDFLTELSKALKLYQDKTIQQQVNATEQGYDLAQVEAMYRYQLTHGRLWYIYVDNDFAGDFAISDDDEIAIVLSKNYQQQGVATAVLQYFLTVSSKIFWVKIAEKNLPSQRCFEKNNFVSTGKVEENGKIYLKYSVKTDNGHQYKK